MLGGLGLIFGPWLWRLWTALVEERSERIRSDERAEMAAHLHDSVLQTLALIQRRADEPRAVVGLARRQERELRAWLFGRAPTRRRPRPRRRARGASAADVEQRARRPDRDRARSAATARSTTARGARRRGARGDGQRGAPLGRAGDRRLRRGRAPTRSTVFVRDRGRGFDPLTSVPTDRGGIAESIVGRMHRNGGTAVIRSRPGEGTEVELSMRAAPAVTGVSGRGCSSSTTTTCSAAACGPSSATAPTSSARRRRSTPRSR